MKLSIVRKVNTIGVNELANADVIRCAPINAPTQIGLLYICRYTVVINVRPKNISQAFNIIKADGWICRW